MALSGNLAQAVRTEWRRLVTLLCLVAFVFVGAVHAGHHLASAGDAAPVVVVTGPPADGADEGNGASKAEVCVFCALAAAELSAMPAISVPASQQRVETREVELTPRPLRAEFPPPIA